MTKAFDTVDHQLLLIKLQSAGIGKRMIKWIESYLLERYQVVQIRRFYSDSFKVTSGVAQGSRLVPLLFAVFINDIVKVVEHCTMELFADDIRLSLIISSNDDMVKLQQDLDKVIEWIDENKLSVNGRKCQKITFNRKTKNLETEYKINGIIVKQVERVRDLGIILDN